MLTFVLFTVTAVLLLGSFVNLDNAVTGAVPTDGENAAPPVCQTCCQGPAALPGIPGVPGQPGPYGPRGEKGLPGEKGDEGATGTTGEPGAPGNLGPKGDAGTGLPGKVGPMGQPGLSGPTGETGTKGQKGNMGEKGATGEPGAPGNPGPKGETGIGLPGQAGTMGPPGLSGPTGESGVKGQKGEPGEAPDESTNHQVAFTIRRRTEFSSESSSNRLPFEETVTLLPGTNVDLDTGTFTCHVPGTYVFMFSVHKSSRQGSVHVFLKRNEDTVVSAASYASGDSEQVASNAVLVLEQGDSVYLTMQGGVYESFNKYNSFVGFLLYQG